MLAEATLLGRIGRKEFKLTGNGTPMSRITVATTDNWYDKDGQKKESTTWHNVTFFSGLAEVVEKYGEVGRMVYIHGKISNKAASEGDHKGVHYYSVVGDKVKFMPSGGKREESQEEKEFSSEDFDDSVIPF